jgi:hypothetical protein
MNLPDAPPIFKQPGATDRGWWWQLLGEDGREASGVPDEYTGQRFASQGDAESWVGEIWAELAEHGVDAVTLCENDRQVYGPMSLHA